MLNVICHFSIFRGLMLALFVLTMGQNLSRAENSILVWSPMTSGTTATLYGIWGFGSNDVFAVGSGVILHYDGTAWSPMTSETPFPIFRDIRGVGPDNVFAVGFSSYISPGIFHYDGSTWSPSPIFLETPFFLLMTVYGTDATHIYTADGKARSLRYNESLWVDWPYYGMNDLRPFINDLWCAASNDIFGVGPNGTIVHSAGGSWTAMTSGTTAWLHGVWGSGPTDVFAVGSTLQNNGRVLHYDGFAWSVMSYETIPSLMGVWGSSGHDVFAVGGNGTILHYGLPLAVQPRNQKVQFSAGAAIWTISRTGTDTLTWSAEVITGGDWVTIASGATGTDTGTLQVNYLANPSYCPRTAILL